MWDLISPTRDRTRTPCIGRRSPNHWTAREVPVNVFFLFVCLFFSSKCVLNERMNKEKKGESENLSVKLGEKEGQEMKEGAESGVEEASAWNMLECPGK